MSKRDVAAALIGAEVGAALGLLVVGGALLGAPIAVALVGAAAGPPVRRGGARLRTLVFSRWLRSRLRDDDGVQVRSR
jgi:hypothetical protein